MQYSTLESTIGRTPIVALQRLDRQENESRGNVLLAKLEGNNPAGSVKDRAAMSMITRAQERGEIKAGDTLIEATSGNTGIALAMAAAIKGFKMILIMPEDLSIERAQTMKAFGAELILTPKSIGMEGARDLALQMQKEGKGLVLDQFANSDIPGIRKWAPEYLPKIYDPTHVDTITLVSQADAEHMCRRLAREEGIFAGISAAGACWVALELAKTVTHSTIVFIVCDRGDRYLSTGVFPA